MSDLKLPLSCEQFEMLVSDYVDGALTASDRVTMDVHSAQCPSCLALLADVRAIVANAVALPPLSPSRDLWTGIADRLDTPVVSIGATAVSVKRERSVSFRTFAAAAALLVSVSSGITYVATRGSRPITAAPAAVAAVPAASLAPAVDATGAASTANVNPTSSQRVAAAAIANERVEAPAGAESGTRSTTRYASRVENATNFTYEREITAMRRIVDERLGDLDSVTVVEIERNLRIIDKAINDSRRALQNDPRSRFLAGQLDRALESKLDILRRIALL